MTWWCAIDPALLMPSSRRALRRGHTAKSIAVTARTAWRHHTWMEKAAVNANAVLVARSPTHSQGVILKSKRAATPEPRVFSRHPSLCVSARIKLTEDHAVAAGDSGWIALFLSGLFRLSVSLHRSLVSNMDGGLESGAPSEAARLSARPPCRPHASGGGCSPPSNLPC